MKTNRNLLYSVISLSLLVGVATSPAVGFRTPETVPGQSEQYRYIEQPIFRIGWTLGGVALIGLLISGVLEGAQKELGDRNQSTSIARYPLASNETESASGTHCAPI